MRTKKTSGLEVGAVLWNKMITYTSKEIYFQEYNM